jgi:hypothetical protein
VPQYSDRDQLVRLRVALRPESSAEEHARELTQILQGKAPITMPLQKVSHEENIKRTLPKNAMNPDRDMLRLREWRR